MKRNFFRTVAGGCPEVAPTADIARRGGGLETLSVLLGRPASWPKELLTEINTP